MPPTVQRRALPACLRTAAGLLLILVVWLAMGGVSAEAVTRGCVYDRPATHAGPIAVPAPTSQQTNGEPVAQQGRYGYDDPASLAGRSARPAQELLAPQTTDPACDDDDVYLHYTDASGAAAIQSSGVIQANVARST